METALMVGGVILSLLVIRLLIILHLASYLIRMTHMMPLFQWMPYDEIVERGFAGWRARICLAALHEAKKVDVRLRRPESEYSAPEIAVHDHEGFDYFMAEEYEYYFRERIRRRPRKKLLPDFEPEVLAPIRVH